jgi:RHS repeat-associated protein
MKHLISLLLFTTALVVLSPALLRGQAGNDNPTGVAGMFNGNVTTAGSYDPYTGNARRTVTDLVVPGGVGAYPLALVRTANTRYTPGLPTEFGEPGGWRHSYQWSIDDQFMVTPGTSSPLPQSYTVNFADGRREIFRSSGSDTLMRASPGTRERFQRPTGSGDNYCYLVLPDGGKIWFQMEIDRVYPDPHDPGGRTYSTFTFSFLGIIDPYQQVTTISYPGDGSMTVTEPGGRWLKFFYGNSTIGKNEVVLWRVTASDGRRVDYSYIEYTTPGGSKYTSLWVAFYLLANQNSTYEWSTYEYQNDNIDPDGRPLLKSCVDPMFTGPMWRIAYEFLPLAPNSGAVYGQIRSEKYFSASNVVGNAVSTLTVDPGSNVRTETRGDGPARTFTYAGPTLESSTDFKNVSASQTHDAAGFVNSMTDRRNNTTDFVVSPLTGKVTQTTFPLTPPDTQRARMQVTYGYAGCPDPNNRDPYNPYYPCTLTNERGFVTKYFRDTPFKRVVRIEYPDGGIETFAYNNLGQVTSHGMTSGGTEVFEYDDSNGRLLAARDPYHLVGVPTARYQYDSYGRVSGVTDPRGAYLGDPNYTTNYEYDFRGQKTKLTHPVEPGTSYRYYILNQYNVNGTLRISTDESGHATEYQYDDYKRVSFVTPPIAFNGDTMPRTTAIDYSSNADGGYAYDHADSNVSGLTTPGGKIVRTLYDENRRKRSVLGGTGNETAMTSITYDAVGNVETVKDPLGQTSGAYVQYFYDARNRLTDANDQLSGDRNNRGRTVSWTYDLASNKTSELRANNQLITYDEYDSLNRLKQQSVQRDAGVTDITRMSYDFAGNLTAYEDGRQKTYVYGYDFLNRKTSLTYPADDSGAIRVERYHYDYANNLDTFTNRAGAIDTFQYDNRNRCTHQFWDTWPLYTIHEQWMTYDPMGNLVRLRTEGEDIDDFVYDFRNRRTSETQTPSGRPSRMVSYTYDADSNRKTMTYPSGYALTYDYTSRNQLWHQYDAQGALATYEYDLNGNRTGRTLRNGTLTNYTPDALNRLQAVAHLHGSNSLGRFDYHYDAVSRIKSAKRDFNRGDYYQYYLDDQLKNAEYNAYNVDLDSPWGSANTTSLAYDANGNRTSQTNSSSASYAYEVNNLNQYNSVNGSVPSYDATGNLIQHNGWTYGYNNQNQLTEVAGGSSATDFYYDGQRRQILRYEGGQWVYSVWDGWNLLEEYDINGQIIHSYVHGAATDEMVMRFDPGPVSNRIWYYQDAQGSTTHLADDGGNVIEKYQYPPADSGAPAISDANNGPRSASLYGNRFLYTGREYYKDGGVYDYRNRSYLPSLGRFMQPDPVGFASDAKNLYRYCAGDPVNSTDPSGNVFHYTQNGNNIHLYIPLSYIGGTAAIINRLNSGIANAWTGQFNGTYGQYNVTTTVYTPAPGSQTNVILLRPGSGISITTGNNNGGIWYLTQPFDNIEGMAAHEAGHLMLLHFESNGNSSDRKDIMGDITGKVSDKDIYYILNLGRSSAQFPGPVSQPFPGGLTLFGQLQSRLTPNAWNLTGGIRSTPWPGLYNNGHGWSPVGGASWDVRWAQNSGTGNWQADQTTKDYLLGGGENYGEGTHPVSPDLF